MNRAYIVADTGKAITLSFVRDNEEVLRKDFVYQQGKDKPAMINMAITAAQALATNTDFFVLP